MVRLNKQRFANKATETNLYKGSERNRETGDDLQGWDELPWG